MASLRGTLKRFAPLDRDTETFASLLATRQHDLRRAVHNLNLVAGSLGGVDTELASLISSSDTNFTAISQNDTQLEDTLSQFPATLRQADQTLGKVKGFATATGTTLAALQPFARNLTPALKAARPLFKDTTPVIANQLRPVSVSLQPLARTLAPAAASAQQGDAVAERVGVAAEHGAQRARVRPRQGQTGVSVLRRLARPSGRLGGVRPGRQRRRSSRDS